MRSFSSLSQDGFSNLNLIAPICQAVRDEKYAVPTPIQVQAIPYLLRGRDLLGCAQTGTGKTAAFALPILQRLAEKRKNPGPKAVRALVLTPTRELALQISDSFRVYGRYLNINPVVIFGGVPYQSQKLALSRGVDILVATPGRLLDLFNQRSVRVDLTDILVLDEADRMLDMGFLPDIRKVLSEIPSNRQTMLFSATLPDEIIKIARKILTNPIRVAVAPKLTTAENIDQRVLFVDREDKPDLLESVLQKENFHKVLVFTRTKHRSNRLAQKLSRNRIQAEVLHGNKSQSARLGALRKFRSGKARVLVATDIASRGLDVDGITHVINYELPNEAESYIHRIGRTARAGSRGIAISFCDAGERGYLRNIESAINLDMTIVADHPFHSDSVASRIKPSKKLNNRNSVRNGVKGKRHMGRPSKMSNKVSRPRKQSRNGSFRKKAGGHKTR